MQTVIKDIKCEYFTWCHIASVQGCNKLIMEYMTLSESMEQDTTLIIIKTLKLLNGERRENSVLKTSSAPPEVYFKGFSEENYV